MKIKSRLCTFIQAVSRNLIITGLIVSILLVTGGFSNKDQNSNQPDPPIARGFMGQASDAREMKEWGANILRTGWTVSTEELQRMREIGGIKLVVMGAWKDNFTKPEIQDTLCKRWEMIAKKFLPYRDIVWGFDLINEPLDRKQLPNVAKEYPGLALRLIEAIRKVDDQTWIIYEVGPAGMFAGFKNLVPFQDKKIIYSAHYYLPHSFTHAGVKNEAGTTLPQALEKIKVTYPSKIVGDDATNYEMNIMQSPPMSIPKEKCIEWNQEFQKLILQPAREFQLKYNVPIYVGEFSTVRWGDPEMSSRYLREAIEIFEEFGWSWSYCAFNGWTGWNLKHREGNAEYWMPGMPAPVPAEKETLNAAVIRNGLENNRK